jgi:signal transduction histidine kinase
LRSLLGGIVLSADVLSRRAPKNEQRNGTLAETERIKRYAERMDRLIGDLLDVASIDAGKLAVSLVPGDLTALIAEAVDTFQAASAHKGVTLDGHVAKEHVRANFDHSRLLQVLTNLINNSIKFTPRGGAIEVTCEHREGETQVCVSDTGSGIPKQLLESIFERFSQAAVNDRRGLGLGLYISKCIVEAHGGKIWAESEGEGARVSFTLPSQA